MPLVINSLGDRHIHMHACTHACTRTHTHAHTHTHTHTHSHTHTHAHTHTHTHTQTHTHTVNQVHCACIDKGNYGNIYSHNYLSPSLVCIGMR